MPSEQRSRCCALPGFPVGTWTGDKVYKIRMGAPRDYSRHGKGDWATPHEIADETGCPGSWYRNDFLGSVLRYYRRRDKQGNRIENLLLSRCDDELVLEAVRALESYEDIANAEAESAAIRRAQKG